MLQDIISHNLVNHKVEDAVMKGEEVLIYNPLDTNKSTKKKKKGIEPRGVLTRSAAAKSTNLK